MPTGSERITRKRWYELGGFANPELWRRQRNGRWEYYRRVD